MRPRVFAWGAPALVAAGILASCGSSTGSPAATSAASSPSPTAAPPVATIVPSPPVPTDTVTVVGVGRITVKPDTALISLGAGLMRPTIAAANDAIAADATKLTNALIAGGVARDDITTTIVNLGPNWQNGSVQGYAGNVSLTARVRNVARTGALIAKAAAVIGNDFQSSGISFSRLDTTALVGPARDAAFKDAQEHAAAWAKLSGRTLGSIRSVSEAIPESPSQPPVGMGAGGGAAVPVESGTWTYTLQITVVYALS